jgi:hypothetical protein
VGGLADLSLIFDMAGRDQVTGLSNSCIIRESDSKADEGHPRTSKSQNIFPVYCGD